MSKFIKLGPCEACGSKDNRAEYTNGFWCFGCSKYETKKDTKSLRERINPISVNINSQVLNIVHEIPVTPLKWLLSYGITQKEIKKYGISWAPQEKILVLCMKKDYWQGRNFGYGNQKYKSNGNKPSLIYGRGKTLVLVEDILSAIKISRTENYAALPLLGSSLSKDTESKIIKRYKTIYVWLDRDKAKNSILIKNRLRSFDIISKTILTTLDPKVYSKQNIINILEEKK